MDIAPEKHTSDPATAKTVEEVSIIGLFFIVIIVFLVIILRRRRSRKQYHFENPMFDDSHPGINNEITEGRYITIFELSIEIKIIFFISFKGVSHVEFVLWRATY